MQAKALAFALLVAASVLDLPAVYLVLAGDAERPPAILAVGLIAMGLAWAGGCALEDRRRGSVTLLALAGVAQLPALLSPHVRDAVEPAAPWLAASGAVAALGLAAVLRSRRAP